MTLSPLWRTRLYASGAAILAIAMGILLANESFALPVLCVGLLGGVMLARITPRPTTTWLIALLVFGYIVGNRGFAQLSLTQTLPLLPAEIVLFVAGVLLVVDCALRQRLPIRRDSLNVLILLWMLVCSVRLFSDVKDFGAVALRDYATIYYAAFFFVAQDAGKNEPDRRFIRRATMLGCAALLVIYPLFVLLPEFFLQTLTFRGMPLVFFKGDLAGTFMAVGAIHFYLKFESGRKWWAIVLSMLLVGATIASNNRASMLGLFVATVLLALGRRWRFAVIQMVLGVFATLVILFVAHLRNKSWHQTPVYSVYEQVLSLADPGGKRTYSASESGSKGDNNLFRAVWWRVVYDETMENSPIVGLGFGHNLAERFVRAYYPDTDEFATRSPHNILITLFARTGLVGLLPFLGIVIILFYRTVPAARQGTDNAALWAGSCVILVSACFGVVLEGPMGAVVFWTLLGIANATYVSRSSPQAAEELPAPESADPLLREPVPARQVAAAP